MGVSTLGRADAESDVVCFWCRAIQDLHHQTVAKLGISAEAREDVDTLLTQLQQLLVGISIMQVRRGGGQSERAWRWVGRERGRWIGQSRVQAADACHSQLAPLGLAPGAC